MSPAITTPGRTGGVRWGRIGLTAGIAIAVLYLIRAMLTPLILAAILAYLITPLVNFGERRGIPRWASISLVYLAMGGVVTLAVIFLVPVIIDQIVELRRQVKNLWFRLPTLVDGAEAWLHGNIPGAERFIGDVELDKKAMYALQGWATSALAEAPRLITAVLTNLVSFISYFVMVPFIGFFLTRDGRRIRRGLIELVPNHYFETILNALSRVDTHVGLYLRGVVLQTIVVGVLAAIGLTIIGMNQALIVGIIAGAANLVPYLGPTVGVIVGAAVALAGDTNIVSVLIVFGIVQFIDAWITSPYIMARSVNTHPLAVFLILWLGGTYFGILGMLLGVPLVFAAVVAVRTIREGLGPSVDYLDTVTALQGGDMREG